LPLVFNSTPSANEFVYPRAIRTWKTSKEYPAHTHAHGRWSGGSGVATENSGSLRGFFFFFLLFFFLLLLLLLLLLPVLSPYIVPLFPFDSYVSVSNYFTHFVMLTIGHWVY
jgi:hypothetical protein